MKYGRPAVLGGSEPTTSRSHVRRAGPKETITWATYGESRAETSHSWNTISKLTGVKQGAASGELAVRVKCILQLRGVRPFLSDDAGTTSRHLHSICRTVTGETPLT